MGFLKKIFGEKHKEASILRPDIVSLLSSNNTDKLILELDDYICKLCEYGSAIEKLSETQKMFFFNQNLEREINNGGFHQFFLNSSGSFAHETIASLNAIGANKTSLILQEAIEQFPSSTVPKKEALRREVMEKIEDKADEIWHKLDEKFYSYEENLYDLNIEYIKQNQISF